MLCTEDIRAAEGCHHNFNSDEDVGGCLEARWRDLEVSFLLDTQTLRLDVHIDSTSTRLQLRMSRPERKPRQGP